MCRKVRVTIVAKFRLLFDYFGAERALLMIIIKGWRIRVRHCGPHYLCNKTAVLMVLAICVPAMDVNITVSINSYITDAQLTKREMLSELLTWKEYRRNQINQDDTLNA